VAGESMLSSYILLFLLHSNSKKGSAFPTLYIFLIHYLLTLKINDGEFGQ